jgi:hypothetical protein
MNSAFDLCWLDMQQKSKFDPDTESQEMMYQEQLQIATDLGLDSQAQVAATQLRALRRPEIITAPLSDTELAIWREWLPTAYRGEQELKEYIFDVIPVPILQLIQEWKKADVFDLFEIRTPEKHKPDPALFGIRGHKSWLLARWAESDDQIVSFDEIKRRLRPRVWGYRRNCLICSVSFCFVFLLSLVAGYLGRAEDALWLFVAGFLGVFVSLGGIIIPISARSQKKTVWNILKSSNMSPQSCSK